MSGKSSDTSQSWFKKMLAKYDKFCEELGVNQGACRGCVPVVKFDPEKEPKPAKSQDKNATEQHSS
ncbi:DUF5363 domain-containing protein [Actinobacillus capsulatus]|uniref:DUF5363 domain-containing protein n=1 Tax=Actinobacillus capsulatus TaxID=717 RepID=UPI0003737039|nr:DUF5363 domain-containing protein [Actinobacillus capsulatus]